jgi:serine/threonine protein kinase
MTADDNDDRTVIKPQGAPPAQQERTMMVAAPPPGSTVASDTVHNSLPVGTMLGEFEITRVLGEGGFGIVYLARDTSLDRRVALKEYMPSALAARVTATQISVKSERHRDTFEAGRKSFVNEAKLLAQFDHPALVKVYRFWEANGTAYMIMPFYEGVTLKDKLKEIGSPPDEAWLISMLAPLTEALRVIHADNCFHRDIAPDNVILLSGSELRPLLLDFGAARRVIGDMTQALTVILKPGYAPIEQYAEVPSLKQGPWTDVYALAAVIYYAIIGKTPPPAVGRLMSDNYVPLVQAAAGRGYSERFLSAIDHALKVRPEERTQSIEDLRAELGLEGTDLDFGDVGMAPGPSSPGAQRTIMPVPPTVRAPAPGSKPTAKPASAPPPASLKGPQPAAAPSQAKSKTGMFVGIGVAAAVVIGGGVFFALGSGSPSVPAPSTAATPVTAPPPAASAAVDQAPAPTPVAAVPAPPPPPPSITAEFDRVLAAQATGYDVQAIPARQQVRIGKEDLQFTVSSSREGFAYVLLDNNDGSLLMFYPNDKVTNNKIKAGQKLVLPQATWPLETSEPTGPMHFLVIVSQSPRDFSAFGNDKDYIFQKLPTGSAAAALLRGYSGPGSAYSGKAKCDGANCDVYGAAQFTLNVVK